VKIRLEDKGEIKRKLKDIGRQAPFALSLGLNNLGLAAQIRARQKARQAFSMRGTSTFFDKGIVFTRGTKARPTAELSIGVEGAWPGTATKRASAILARHEEGGARQSTAVVRSSSGLVPAGFFLPGPGMRTGGANPSRKLYPSAIGATLRRQVSGEQRYAKDVKGRGAKRSAYYVVPNVGIFERKSGGLGSRSRPIWFFARRVATPARTGMREAADATITELFDAKMSAAITQAMATAR